MKILVMDLEMNINQDEGNSSTSTTTDIIQIGACVLDTDNGNVVDIFSKLIKLQTAMDNNELRLSKFIEKLTGIKQADIDKDGVSLLDAYDDLILFARKNEVLNIGASWGLGDFDELMAQVDNHKDFIKTKTPPDDLEKYDLKTLMFNDVVDGKNVKVKTDSYFRKVDDFFGTARPVRVFDVKKLYQLHMIMSGKNYRGGLKKACNNMGLTLMSNKSYHDALTDAIQTARILYKMGGFLKEK